MLSAHYRSPLNFSAELMEAAGSGLERIRNAVSNLQYLSENASGEDLTEEEQQELSALGVYREKFEEAMDDDFNTADAVSAVFELVKYANSHVTASNSKAWILRVKEEILGLCDILGIIAEKKEELLDEEIEKLIQERQEARKAKNFARADEIRAQLLEKGITLLDTREGVKWKRA